MFVCVVCHYEIHLLMFLYCAFVSPGMHISSTLPLDESPPKKAKVVICGGGMVGTSLLYHLAELGWGADTVMVDQARYGVFSHLQYFGLQIVVLIDIVRNQTFIFPFSLASNLKLLSPLASNLLKLASFYKCIENNFYHYHLYFCNTVLSAVESIIDVIVL